MSTTTPDTYDKLLSRAQQLTPVEQLLLAEQLIASARRQIAAPSQQHSILELRGLGKEAWGNVDAQAYVNQERDSWNG